MFDEIMHGSAIMQCISQAGGSGNRQGELVRHVDSLPGLPHLNAASGSCFAATSSNNFV
jgi:hypothetical protein